jgi:hypothetical protein
MSSPAITRRVAVFTLFLLTVWMAATTAASAMLPDPPGSAPHGSTHPAPATAVDGGPDVTVWLLTAIAVVAVVVAAALVAAGLHRRHLHPPTQAAH